MAVTTLSIHSQAAKRQDGFYESGQLPAGVGSLFEELRWAIRFELPSDFDSAVDVTTATLNLYASATSGNYRVFLAALDSPTQALPADNSEMFDAGGLSAVKYLGTSSSSPAPDYVVGGSYATVAIDVKAMVNEARAAGYLAGGYVAFIVSNSGVSSNQIINAHGIGQANPPTLYLDYYANSPPPDPLVAQPENSQTRSQGSQPQAIPHWTATPAAGQTRSGGSEPQPIIVGVPENSQTRLQANHPQAIPNWTATPQDSQTRSQADEPQPDTAYVAQPANSQTRSQASEPQVTATAPHRRRPRTLFPADLFPADLMVSR